MIHIIADVILFHKCRTHRDVARGAEDEIDEDGEERHVETDHGRQLRQQRVRHACKHGGYIRYIGQHNTGNVSDT